MSETDADTLDGKIEALTVRPYALSACEIQTVMREGILPKESHSLAHGYSSWVEQKPN